MEGFNSPSDNPYYEGVKNDLEPKSETIDGGAPYPFEEVAQMVDKFTSNDLEEPIGEVTDVRTTPEGIEFDLKTDLTLEEMDEMVDKAISLVTEKQGVNKAGSENKLNKRSVLMNLHDDQRTDTFAYFEHFGDEDGVRLDGYYMPLEFWDDFGRPDTITVVVYPRDMFN